MDLLGNIGNDDQLVSAREEIKILQHRVKELTEKLKVLTLEKETLRAEVEIYRSEAAMPSFSKLALGQVEANSSTNAVKTLNRTDFISPGNGIYPHEAIVSIANPHGHSNPLCCALHPNDSILGTGGADSTVSLSFWGAALQPSYSSSSHSNACMVKCNAPVITLAFAPAPLLQNILAVGCMDGSIELISFSQTLGTSLKPQLLKSVDVSQDGFMENSVELISFSSTTGTTLNAQLLKSVDLSGTIHRIKHNKYIKALAWSTSHSSPNILVSASADGVVHVSRIVPQYTQAAAHDDTMMVTDESEEDVVSHVIIEKVTSFYLQGAVETLCFLQGDHVLCLYEHNTPYLTYFDLADANKQTKINLNGTLNGGFEDHVSFTVMQLALSPNGKYLCAATDTSRIIIMDASSGEIVRNLYGHKTDSYFTPRIAWSHNGQYIFGNTQDDNSICVWDIASSAIVKRLDDKSSGGHSGQIRDLYSSSRSDTIVSASYDKTVKVWTYT